MVFSFKLAFTTAWKAFNSGNGIPSDAFLAGVDSNNKQIYIGRGVFNGVLIPGRIWFQNYINRSVGLYVEQNKVELYSLSGVEYYVNDPNCNYNWVSSKNGLLIANAVNVTSSKAYYIGRIFFQGTLQVGKVLLKNAMYFAPNYSSYTYEVLVCNRKSNQNSKVSHSKYNFN